ncbi:hypothetical protein [Chitinophaga ginsengisoli]|uniref:Uncharacterized protein n=1 Tax=Chitinophaga ginsengisoli TaxID=363837 RepID=A0A2P8GAK6_9BACT|nr:hypothetical protein [Chitinophaga ginsengisoli]PSL30978.1 hypothetical protein CLV42_105341 [Chitinophaga ginsengisoli]
MFNTLKDLVGLRIDDEKIISFIENNGFKYPKKPFISNRGTDTSYWVENKKLGVDLLFEARIYLDNFSLIQGDKKGIFVPALSIVRWYNNKSKTEFPLGLDFNADFESLKMKLGEPTLKSSEISPIWLNDDGSESFYRWKKPLDDKKDIVWGLEFNDSQIIKYFSLELDTAKPLFHFYYEWLYESFETFLSSKNFYRTADLMFLQWAIEKDFVKTNEQQSAISKDIKEGKLPATEWVRILKRGYVTEEDFSAEVPFIHAYIMNLSGHDILFTRDVAYSFLENAELKDNYFGKAAEEQLNKIVYNEGNYAKVKSIIDKRLAEYKEHKFSKSKQM